MPFVRQENLTNRRGRVSAPFLVNRKERRRNDAPTGRDVLLESGEGTARCAPTTGMRWWKWEGVGGLVHFHSTKCLPQRVLGFIYTSVMANSRKYMIAGNWKMNLSVEQGLRLVERLDSKVGQQATVDVVVAPSFVGLHEIANLLKWSKIRVASQNMSEFESGAYTGDISASMLLTSGCGVVILGHSERRGYFKESDDLIGRKVTLALANKLTPIICVGETAEQRDSSETESVLTRQLAGAFTDSVVEDVRQGQEVIVAYEPVWAIGTGQVATPEIAQESHRFIRNWLVEKISATVGDSTRILYGGSVKPDNAAGLLKQEDIDGALVGGCSLKSAEFCAIIEATPGFKLEAVQS